VNTKLNKTVAFLGAGNMGAAIARGLLATGTVEPGRLVLTDVRRDYVRGLAEELGCRAADGPADAASEAEVLLLAVKPQNLAQLLKQMEGAVTARHLVVSIAAGVPTRALEAGLPEGTPVVRVMPNLMCQVGEAMSVYAPGSHARPEDLDLVATLFRAVGRAAQSEEKLLDAVTGLSGSGPAFIFLVIEALADGGVKAGLPRDLAMELAAQTVLGSAKMVLETGLHPGVLKDRVCSPAGTTIAGVAVLEECAVRSAFLRAVEAAARRSAELGG
jgi:pyrroline-5-carboxylate reductase